MSDRCDERDVSSVTIVMRQQKSVLRPVARAMSWTWISVDRFLQFGKSKGGKTVLSERRMERSREFKCKQVH